MAERCGKHIFEWLSLLRIKHWIKNVLVVIPLFFAGALFNPGLELQCWLGFLAFSMMASAVYINNDINDLESDKKHPTKSSRPLAAGTISLRAAYATLLIFVICSVALSVFLSIKATVILATYAILNVAYSKGLKNHPVLDVAIVALGFVLRILFGGYCCDIPISLWLYLTTFSFSLFFALGKRRGELARIGTDSRKALEKYNNTFLNTTMNSFLTCGMVFMSLWAFEKVAPTTASVSAASLLVVAGIPLVMIICMRYTYDLERSECEGDPVNVLLADRALVVLTLLCFLAMFCSLYLVS